MRDNYGIKFSSYDHRILNSAFCIQSFRHLTEKAFVLNAG
jgi:hypothetical protein